MMSCKKKKKLFLKFAYFTLSVLATKFRILYFYMFRNLKTISDFIFQFKIYTICSMKLIKL